MDVQFLITNIVEEAIEKQSEEMKTCFDKRFKELDPRISQNSLKLDQILRVLGSTNHMVLPSETTSSPAEDVVEGESFGFNFPINDPDEIVELEIKLSRDAKFKKILMKELSMFGGTGKNENADKVIYSIFDFLFNAEVLTKFTWTGASRSQEIVKRSFQKFENIIELVYNVLSLADSRHTKNKNESLIRDKVLKHTNQRLTRKMRKHQKKNNDKNYYKIDKHEDTGEENMSSNNNYHLSENSYDPNLMGIAETDIPSLEEAGKSCFLT